MKKILLSILLIILSSTAQAEDVGPNSFKDWFALTSLLRTKGIDPSSPSWASIIPMCLPLKNSDDEAPYNRCLYEKSMDEYQWHIDNKYCADRSDKEYRDSLQNNTSDTVNITDSSNKKIIIEKSKQPSNANKDPVKDRNTYYKDCMIIYMNWNAPDRWMSGKRK